MISVGYKTNNVFNCVWILKIGNKLGNNMSRGKSDQKISGYVPVFRDREGRKV